ncbi:acyl-CoA dehydrogenase family protein [Paraburkholderia sediminicola]|uniref:acyl-CoA dehydrogenase family protein n=1 Tax=Paraburkholderia sediminicola TaxID=458836 RepID=UPI0038B9013C
MIFTHEHEELRRTMGRFVSEHINPYVDAWEEEGIFPAHELFKKAGDAGLLGITKPAAFGGMELDYSFSVVAAEEWGRAHAGGVTMAIGVQTDMATPSLARHGSDALREEFLTPAIAGDMVACVGVSEEGAGSDVANLKSYARKDGGDYIINGSKMWITNGTQADWMCMLVNTSNDNGPHRNKSLIIVPMKTPGVVIARKLKKLGMHSSDTAQIFFDDVRVPQRYLVGEEGRGFVYQMEQFQEERLYGAAKACSQLEQAIGTTVEYTRDRKAFGQSILDNQVVHHKLAEMMTEVEALRALTYRACELYVAGQDVNLLASMAKFKAGRLTSEIPSACLQYWGGQGYMWESRISRLMRDMRLTGIGGGANEIMLQIISKLMGILPRGR